MRRLVLFAAVATCCAAQNAGRDAEQALGWRVALASAEFGSLNEAADAAAALGLRYVEAEARLVAGDVEAIRAELARNGIGIAVYRVPAITPEAVRAAVRLGAEWIVAGEAAAATAAPDRFLLWSNGAAPPAPGTVGASFAGGRPPGEFLRETYRRDVKPFVLVVSKAGAAAAAPVIAQLVDYHRNYGGRTAGVRRLAGVSEEERAKIEAAIPDRAPEQPKKPRKVLVFDLNVGRLGHPSIPHANMAVQRMGEKTGAYEATVSSDSAVFARLNEFDAVFLNNTIGDIFGAPQVREAFRSFVTRGGGVVANHAVTVTETEWSEFGNIIGARGASHRMTDEKVTLRVEDAQNPITRVFEGRPFDYADEIFRYTAPYSRYRARVLLSVDPAATDMNQGRCFGACFRADNDYPAAWVQRYGSGRVFVTTFGHNPYVFWDPRMLRMFLAAIQYATGDLAVDDTPSKQPGTALEPLLAPLKEYAYGADPAPVHRLTRELREMASAGVDLRGAEKSLLGFLESNAKHAAKHVVCRELSVYGSAAAVPVLKRLAGDPAMAEMARYALERLKPLPQIAEGLASESEEARLGALELLTTVPAADHLPVVLSWAASGTGPVQAAARMTLARMPGTDVDFWVVNQAGRRTGAERIELIRAMGERAIPYATTELLSYARASDPAMRREAIRALRGIVQPEDTRALLDLLLGTPEEDRADAERILSAALRRSAEPDLERVVAMYRFKPEARVSLVNVLAQTGSKEALPVLREALNSGNDDLQRAAVNGLADWPAAEPMADLEGVARNAANPSIRILALRGYLKLMEMPAGRAPAETAKFLSGAMKLASRPDEKKTILSLAQRTVCPESLALAEAAQKDPAVAAEAKTAVQALTRALAAHRD